MPETEEMMVEEPVGYDTPDTSNEVLQEPGELYAVKVDGEEQQVSLEELQNGYQRQADYTRKTQEIAAEKERLQQAEAIVSALEADPKATLEALAQTLDVSVDLGTSNSEDDEYLDPTEKKLRDLEAKIQQQEAVERQRSVEREVLNLQEQYGEFDRRELLNHAMKHKISNLDAAYAHWQFNDVKSTADKLQEERDITDSKRSAAAVVTTGGSTQAGTQTQAPKSANSIREAFALAKEQLGT
mgnify:FL=1